MNQEKYDVLYKSLTLIDNYFNQNKPVPYEEGCKALILVGMISKIKEKYSISKISNLKVDHNCYNTLQLSYRIISKEASFTLNNITDKNLAIIIGQFGILANLEAYLKKEDDIPINILMEMNERTVRGIGESSKIFKKINNMSR